jgi:voltage-gated potassium channel
MFLVAALFLVILAGLLHRLPREGVTEIELHMIGWGIGLTWLAIALEQPFRFLCRNHERSAWRAAGGALLFALIPPLRMGAYSQTRDKHIWLPLLDWQPINDELRRRLERFFSIPMIVIALMVLPFLAIEYGWAEEVRAEPGLALFLDIGVSFIWLAFAVEFITMVSVAENKLKYCYLHWIDLAIVLLPLVEVLPFLRVLRVGRVLRAEELTRLSRLYRLQGLAMRAWRGFLLLGIVQRLIRRSPEHRLHELEALLLVKEDEVNKLRKDIEQLREEIAQKQVRQEQAALPEVSKEPLDPQR